MDRPRAKPQPAASANRLPTIHSTPAIKRSVTSTTAVGHDEPGSISTHQVKGQNQEAINYSLQMKTALTELLNDGRVKGSTHGSRCLQNILMQTERDMRSERRKSLNAREAK
ncbi:hypothetical protein BDV29DRAFT_172513 [Aspergillus leporis]|jgi:hypothetical protein|uniref:Uncharacterized protein n=1 Tax=Aspergillus leporis TaxID=41062 RepID=A0A5N5X4V4_9EURO|nr:hypothetical protein BDV29DRAFT_172513 [Aspergillus leporis]